MPIEGMPLHIEPSFPNAEALSKISARPLSPDDVPYVRRNVWWSRRKNASVHVVEVDGKIRSVIVPRNSRATYEINTLLAADAWGIEQEATAIQLLGKLVGHRAFKAYMLTGMFLETSKRSGLSYLFRKLRPTLVLDGRSQSEGESTKILCALCLHPIAYYEDSWAGAMTPTDDVIAHLMLMRGDEPMLWRRANQHAPYRPEAGL